MRATHQTRRQRRGDDVDKPHHFEWISGEKRPCAERGDGGQAPERYPVNGMPLQNQLPDFDCNVVGRQELRDMADGMINGGAWEAKH